MADVQYAKNHFEVFSSVTDQLTALYSFTGWPLMTPAVFMLEIFAYSIRSLHLPEIQFRFWITKVLTGYNYRTGSLLYRVFFKTVLIHLDCIQGTVVTTNCIQRLTVTTKDFTRCYTKVFINIRTLQ